MVRAVSKVRMKADYKLSSDGKSVEAEQRSNATVNSVTYANKH
jgi:hypothetical protein